MKPVTRVLVVVVAALLGAGVTYSVLRAPPAGTPDGPTVVEQMRDVARLETLHLSVYKKISFEPQPTASDSSWDTVRNWIRFEVGKPPQGRAIVFAQVELGIDLQKLTPKSLRITGQKVEVVLPEPEAQVQLIPSETEIIGSTLNSAETAQLFDKAKTAFEREVVADPRLMQKAKASNERAMRALLITLGFKEVVFVDRLTGVSGS